MPKLPDELVLDNPLRRTGPREKPEKLESREPDLEPALEAAPDGDSGADVISIASKPKAKPKAARRAPLPVGAPAATEDRITVRIDGAIRLALEEECFRRRIAGDKTNIAEIARGILSSWSAKQKQPK